MRRMTPKRRIEWIDRYLDIEELGINAGYAEQFCEKVLDDFHLTGQIPEEKLHCISIVANCNECKALRKFLRNLGIKHKSYWILDGEEIVIDKSDYNLFRVADPSNIFSTQDFIHDIDIGKLFDSYKEYERKFQNAKPREYVKKRKSKR